MPLQVEALSWDQASARCLSIRRRVFIQEQGIDEAIEIDGRDPQCWHVLARLDGVDVGTARMQPDGHIGRVAVLSSARGSGAGRALMRKLCDIARQQGLAEVHLSSQDTAIGFYLALGFAARGAMFMEAGIPHQDMSLTLAWPD